MGRRSAMLEGKQVSAFRQVHENRICCTFGAVVLCQLETKASGLDPDSRIQLGIKIDGAMKNFSRNFIFF
jgi:hypothetical protein